MAVSDGNGWVQCRCGSRHWGRFGAAGLLLVHEPQHSESRGWRAPLLTGQATVLLQHRAVWSHEGGTWGLPGGARDSHEDIVTTALRETYEEAQIDASSAALLGVQVMTHGDWSYTTVIMAAGQRADPRGNSESISVRWLPAADIDDLPLHPGFATSWPTLRGPMVRLVVDVSNVMGSRPDGWWRDRTLAAQRLIDELADVVGVARTPDGALVTMVAAVVEGTATPVVSPHPAVLVSEAVIADVSIRRMIQPGDLVVTADADLRRRVTEAGGDVIGPQWLLKRIAELSGR